MGVLPFTIKDHKSFVLNFLLTIGNRCVGNRGGCLIPWCCSIVAIWASDIWSYFFAAGRFLPQQFLPLTRRSPSPLLSVFSCVLLSRFLCLPSDAARRFFKGLRIQPLDVMYWNFSTLTCSGCVAEVTQVNTIAVSPIQCPGFPGYWNVAWGFRCQSSQASQSIHDPRNSECYSKGWRLLYLVASVWMSWLVFRLDVIYSDVVVLTIL
jgi:hypothetical protein